MEYHALVMLRHFENIDISIRYRCIEYYRIDSLDSDFFRYIVTLLFLRVNFIFIDSDAVPKNLVTTRMESINRLSNGI